MCGLAGFIQRDGSAADVRRLGAMIACLAHRGPDDEGVELRGRVAMGHRRLSIVDLSPAGHQPMNGPDSSTLIAYNGEVYNHRSLRERLGSGPEYRGGSDTEVVARVLATRGAEGLALLNGIFALAWLDEARGELLLARDQFGIKPLYFAEDGERFYFASEVKAIVAGGLSAAAEPLAPLDFAYTGWTADERTFLRGVRRLPPGSFLRYELSSGRWRVERYFTPAPDVERARGLGERYGAWKDAVREQLERTIEAQLMSDVPVGTFCSGGIDSSLVTAMAARRHGTMLAFNVTCPDSPALDEGPYARAVARHVGVELRTLELTQCPRLPPCHTRR
ncbi:asparagine synthase (glutamine-hydrolyzing) [Leptolyngbya sp. 15MV]|nr:asparagine synthase (glutamine-hydrolyzing) [Leptolyngbya sp. 15MV]